MREDDEKEIALFQDGVWQLIIIGREGNNASVCRSVGDVSALYYPEKETGDSTRSAQRVVAIEDLWGMLVGTAERDGREWRNT